MAFLFVFDPAMLAPAQTLANLVLDSPVMLAYVGPDQILPLASVLSAIAGIALVFWNKLRRSLACAGRSSAAAAGRRRRMPASGWRARRVIGAPITSP